MGSSTSSASTAADPNQMVYSYECKQHILMNGLDAAGKTTVLYKAKAERPELFSDEIPLMQGDNMIVTTIPTIGFNIECCYWHDIYHTTKEERKKAHSKANGILSGLMSKTSTSEYTYRMYCWDVGGRDKIRPLWRYFYQECKGIIFVVDMVDTTRREEVKEEISRMLAEDTLPNQPLLIVLNKRDLLDRHSYRYGPEFYKQDWINYFKIYELMSFSMDELKPILTDSYLGKYCNEDVILSLSDEITALCFGDHHREQYTVRSQPEATMRRAVKYIECSVTTDWLSFEEGLEWLFEEMAKLR